MTAVMALPRPCDPATIWGVCRGGCGRTMHTKAPGSGNRGCAAGRLDEFPSVFAPDPEPGGDVVDEPTRGGDPDWRLRAACRDVDPEPFFPSLADVGGDLRPITAVAWRYCQGCPVLDQCGDLADLTSRGRAS